MLAVGLWCAATVPALATTFVFDQTGSTVPGFVVSATISVGGTLADLPSISNQNNPGPYDFSPLSALDITLPTLGGDYTLADFTPRGSVLDYPQWSISRSEISFIDQLDNNEFNIAFGPASTILFESDAPTEPPECHFTGRCIASGNWDPVPEPASSLLLLASLIGGALSLRRRRQLQHQH
ncbi:MAG: PEP-CTERM sorting domain-containing protein [Stellaceae bacterium]